MGRLRVASSCVGLLLVAGCMQPGREGPRGMRFATARVHDRDDSLVELARAQPQESERALLVVYPRSACSGSASGVIVDDRRRFLGAVVPGSAALMNVPKGVRDVSLFSSVEVTAPVGTWHDARRVTLPSPPGGLVIRSARWSARECATGQYFDISIATKIELEAELAESDIRWLAPIDGEGQAWLDAHRSRVAEVLSTPPSGGPPGDITHLILR